MRSESLLEKAIINLKSAQKLLIADDGDDIFLNIIAYHVQQAAELLLKHYLEESGVWYERKHDIGVLIAQIEENNVNIKLTERFELMAGTFTEWEVKTSYYKDYFAARRMVLRGIDILQDIFILNGISIKNN